MNLHLRYSGCGVVRMTPLRGEPNSSHIRLHYLVCDEDAQPIESRSGRYEDEYVDSYRPHSEEVAMLARLEAINSDITRLVRLVNRIWKVQAVPHPEKPYTVRYEVMVTVPFEIEFGDIELK